MSVDFAPMTKATAAAAAGPARRLRSARVELLDSQAVSAVAVLEYHQRNEAHFARWDPPMPPGFLSARHQADRLRQANEAFAAGIAYRYWLVEPAERRRVIGTVHFSTIVRGAFHSAMLGIALDHAAEGRGLMAEALGMAFAEMFSPRVNLHRVQAAVRPENERSLAVMRRLGFEAIGLARRYLLIDGDWRDHLLWQRINPDWVAPAA